MWFQKKSVSSGSIEWLVVGLGNPGKQYENTRHNAGFLAMDAIAEDCGVDVARLKFKAVVGEAVIGQSRCLLMKPDTFMNNSGEAIRAAAQFYKIPAERVLVLYDDISLRPGQIRIRRKGSDGGHNGIKSIISLLGSDQFPRIKLGVGAKPHPEYDLVKWVLASFSSEDRKSMQEAFDKCPDIVRMIVEGRIDDAMNRYNS